MAALIFYSLLTFIAKISNVNGDILWTVLNQMDPNREIFTVTAGEEVDLTDSIVSKFFYSTYDNETKSSVSATSQNLLNIQRGIERVFQSTSDVVIVVNMKLENSTYQVLQNIGNVAAGLRELRRIWTVVIWPYRMNSSAEIQALKQRKDYLDATSNFLVNSQLFIAFPFLQPNSSETVVTYEAFRAANHTALKQLEKGVIQWSCNFCEGVSLRRFNFHGRVLKMTAVNDTEVNDDIHVYVDPNGKIRYGKYGLSGSILDILQRLLNFTAEARLSKEFGSLIPGTNRWMGSIGEVAEGIVDLAISVTIFQPNRASVVSFLPPADEHLIHAFFTPPDVNSVRDIFAQPFGKELWAAVITTWIVLALCMIMFSRIRKRYEMDNYNGTRARNETEEPDFTNDSFIWALGTACQQGWEEHPKALSLRAIFLSGSFTGVVAYAGYSAAIVSSLSLRIDPIRNPSQLLQSNLDVGIRKGFISSLLEQNKTRDTMSRFYKKVEGSPEPLRYLNISSGLDQVLRHPYAFISTRDTVYDLLKTTTDDKVICSIKDMPVLKYGFPIGYPVPKFSPYREILRYAMTMIREPGILYRLRLKYSFQRRCLDSSNKAGYALGPTDVFTAYMILCGGIALSLGFLIAERCFTFGRFTYLR